MRKDEIRSLIESKRGIYSKKQIEKQLQNSGFKKGEIREVLYEINYFDSKGIKENEKKNFENTHELLDKELESMKSSQEEVKQYSPQQVQELPPKEFYKSFLFMGFGFILAPLFFIGYYLFIIEYKRHEKTNLIKIYFQIANILLVVFSISTFSMIYNLLPLLS